MAKKIVNPETGKKIKVGGTVYLKLKRQGKLPKSRKGPTPSAKKYKIGKRKRGNDGRMWEVVKYAKGRRWQAVSKKKGKKSPIHPSLIGRYPSEDVMRMIDDLADWKSACKVSKWHRKFCTSKEGKDIEKRLGEQVAHKLNEWFEDEDEDENLSYEEWMYVEELDLRSGNIKEIPKELGYLTNLKTLNLDNNQISSIPEGVFDNLHNLTELSLSNNQLTSLPKGVFDGLHNLTILNLSNNALTSLPKGTFNNLHNLQFLSLSDNQLEELPKGAFDGLHYLRYLFLNSNRISRISEEIFGDSPYATQISVSVHNNPLKEEDIPPPSDKVYFIFN